MGYIGIHRHVCNQCIEEMSLVVGMIFKLKLTSGAEDSPRLNQWLRVCDQGEAVSWKTFAAV